MVLMAGIREGGEARTECVASLTLVLRRAEWEGEKERVQLMPLWLTITTIITIITIITSFLGYCR